LKHCAKRQISPCIFQVVASQPTKAFGVIRHHYHVYWACGSKIENPIINVYYLLHKLRQALFAEKNHLVLRWLTLTWLSQFLLQTKNEITYYVWWGHRTSSQPTPKIFRNLT
jgi:hypothetical protein